MSQTIPTPKTMQQHRFHLLDGIRGIAAAMVVFFHAPTPVARCFPNAYLAVDLFFCLSGFVIAYSYENRLADKLRTKDFFVLRLLRFYLIYLLGTVLLLIRSPLSIDGMSFWHSSPGYYLATGFLALIGLPRFGLPSINVHLYPFNPPAWSLLAEMIVNIAYAFSIRAKLKWIVLPILCALSLGMLVFTASHSDTFNHTSDLTVLARVFFSFPVGVFLYALYKKRNNAHSTPSGTAIVVAMVVTTVALSFHSHLPGLWPQLLIITVVSPALVYFGAGVKVPLKIVATCVILGDISYPVYMLQGAFRIPDLSSIDLFGEHHVFILGLCVVVEIIILGIVSKWVNHRIDEPMRKKITAWYRARTESKLLPAASAVAK